MYAREVMVVASEVFDVKMHLGHDHAQVQQNKDEDFTADDIVLQGASADTEAVTAM